MANASVNLTTEDYRNRTVDVIFSFVGLVSTIVGVCGNTLSVIVFFRRRDSDRATTVYLTALSLFDGVMLANSSWAFVTTKAGYLTNNKITFRYQMPNAAFCIAFLFTYALCSLMSSWIIILFSLERMLVMWWPLRMTPYVSSSKPRKVALIALFFVMLTMASGNFRWITLREAAGVKFNRCTGRLDLQPWEVELQTLVMFGFANGIPVVIVAVLNILIVIGIRKNSMSDNLKSKSNRRTDMRCLVNLLLVSFCFLIFVGPNVVGYRLYYYFESTKFYGFSPRGKMMFLQYWESVQALVYLNHAVNCFIYVYSLPFYRQEIKKIFCGASDKPKTAISSHG